MEPYTSSASGAGVFASAAAAAAPILLLLLCLGVWRKPAWLAGLAGLASGLVLACSVYRMPLPTAASAACEGVAFGLFPITWIIFWALVLFRITVETGRFDTIRNSLGALTDDPRLQTLLIAFALGAFLEGAAGFGAPVAIASTLLAGLGFSAFDASALCMLANTAPVAFGSIGIPIVTLAITTGLPASALNVEAGRLCTPVALILPAYLVGARWGLAGLRGVWREVTITGVVFAVVQLAVSTLLGAALTDIVASLVSMLILIALIAMRRRRVAAAAEPAQVVSVPSPPPAVYSPAQAWAPYVLLVACVLLWGAKPVHSWLERFTLLLRWPGLQDAALISSAQATQIVTHPAVFHLNWASAAGTACMAACLLSALLFRMPPAAFARVLAAVGRQLVLPTLTVTSVLALAFVMNHCGATTTLGMAFAASGRAFPFFSAALGWVGVFLTGSDTSSNALFGTLQTVTAGRLGLSPVLMAAANSVGGTMGKMISLQTIAVAAAATGLSSEAQSRLLRFTLRHSVVLLAIVGCTALALAYLHA